MIMFKNICLLAMAVAALSMAAGCSAATYQPSRMKGFQFDTPQEINDEDIRKAFEASPQLKPRLNVAFYAFDDTHNDEIRNRLKADPHIAEVYALPEFMLTGRGRFERRNPWETPTPPSLKQMRLMAARAHCDVLLIFDYGHKVETSPNGLTILNALLIPVFFTPFLDQEVESALDAYVIDVRNGYLYGHVTASEKHLEESVTIWSAEGQDLIDAQWPALLNQTAEHLAALIDSESAPRADRAPADAPQAAPDRAIEAADAQ